MPHRGYVPTSVEPLPEWTPLQSPAPATGCRAFGLGSEWAGAAPLTQQSSHPSCTSAHLLEEGEDEPRQEPECSLPHREMDILPRGRAGPVTPLCSAAVSAGGTREPALHCRPLAGLCPPGDARRLGALLQHPHLPAGRGPPCQARAGPAQGRRPDLSQRLGIWTTLRARLRAPPHGLTCAHARTLSPLQGKQVPLHLVTCTPTGSLWGQLFPPAPPGAMPASLFTPHPAQAWHPASSC